jgi:hypothetical protein
MAPIFHYALTRMETPNRMAIPIADEVEAVETVGDKQLVGEDIHPWRMEIRRRE